MPDAGHREAPITNSPQPRAADHADAAQIAGTAAAAWESIHATLSPVVGARGVAALYRRVVFLASESHPWLSEAAAAVAAPGDFTALRGALSRQDGASAAAAQQQMLQALHDLLDRLIGSSLTQRLLQAVWASTSAGIDRQDNSQ